MTRDLLQPKRAPKLASHLVIRCSIVKNSTIIHNRESSGRLAEDLPARSCLSRMPRTPPRQGTSRKGTNGFSTNWVTANFMFLDRGTFWVLPFTYVFLPKSARAYLFPQSVKFITFAAAPLYSVDPICSQPVVL